MIRLFVGADLHEAAEVALGADQAHYLAVVMRQGAGAAVRVFNGRDGEWRARIADLARRGATLRLEACERAQTVGPDLDLIVALIRRGRFETIVEKAAELGARRVAPVITERALGDRTRSERLVAIATEAAEQTGRLDVPQVLPAAPLDALLGDLRGGRRLMFCDEAGEAPPAAKALAEAPPGGAWAILIGPEGGFSAAERARIRALPQALAVSLGPRILRADTAAISAMTLWQAHQGDWRGVEVGRAAGQVTINDGGTKGERHGRNGGRRSPPDA